MHPRDAAKTSIGMAIQAVNPILSVILPGSMVEIIFDDDWAETNDMLLSVTANWRMAQDIIEDGDLETETIDE